ncbi:hypothetical protein PRIPAC_78331 [Pristionchus pacificus]|uniref:Uncharacterized protein n=1 Tax=Pristionchus pacificus TaxID=54126 RepID=A0A2A6CQE9_PRIPA|nr:hypothetical protein PRIPAC_78331 [Pristionchus pacificus]|eukprot:PDM80369.1 hypothetical protein PRIPAC_32948 [Pristionchus pacificus]
MNSESSYASTFAMCIYYLPIGTIATLANFINLAMYMHTKERRKTYMCFIALELGELINSVSFLLTGSGRLELLRTHHFYMSHTVHECFYGTFWVHSQILGTEIPTLFLIMTSVERIVAVCWPERFNKIFTEKKKGVMIVACTLLGLASLGSAAATSYNNAILNNSGHCGIIHSTAEWFATSHFVFIIVGYGVSLLSLVIMKIYSMKFRMTGKQGSRHDSKTNILIAFTGASLLLVASPSIVMIGLRYKWFVMEDMWVALTYSTTVMISIANMIINFIFRADFRQTFFRCMNAAGITHHKDELFSHLHHTTSSHH